MGVVDTIFAVINTGVLVAFFGYVARKYVVPSIKLEAAEHHARDELLKTQQKLALERSAQLDHERIAAERWHEDFLQQVDVWRQAVARQIEERQHEQDIFDERARVRRAIQQREFSEHLLSARIVPHALAQARLELYDYYQQPEHGHCYLQKSLECVERMGGE